MLPLIPSSTTNKTKHYGKAGWCSLWSLEYWLEWSMKSLLKFQSSWSRSKDKDANFSQWKMYTELNTEDVYTFLDVSCTSIQIKKEKTLSFCFRVFFLWQWTQLFILDKCYGVLSDYGLILAKKKGFENLIFICYFYMTIIVIKWIKICNGTRTEWEENSARTYLKDLKREKKGQKEISKADIFTGDSMTIKFPKRVLERW